MKRLSKVSIGCGGSIVVGLFVLELFVGWAFGWMLGPAVDDEMVCFHHHDVFGWFPQPGIDRDYASPATPACAKIRVRNNSLGFRDVEHGIKTRPRVAFIGDSYVWGYGVEQERRFSDRLQAMRPDLEIVNLGVSGYGTDQAYLLLQAFFDEIQPDVVILVFYANDVEDNSTNLRYLHYFKPYFTVDDAKLQLHGVPVPSSLRRHSRPVSYLVEAVRLLSVMQRRRLFVDDPTLPLIRAIDRFARDRGAAFAVGFAGERPPLGDELAADGIASIELAGADSDPDCRHWSSAGHDEIAGRLDAFLEAGTLPRSGRQGDSR